jgi:dihydrodipicolinate synthase/N-acetylneuraminate lyase
MATPLLADGETVNVDEVGRLADFLLQKGVKGLFVAGTTGEGILLPDAQRRRLFAAAMDAVGGRAPVLLHVGANRLAEAQGLAAYAGELAPAGIVAVSPYFYGIPDAASLVYFQQLAAVNPSIPFFAYDIPHMAINGISPGLLRDLQESVPNFAGVKCSQGNAQAIAALLRVARVNHSFFVGNERLASGTLSMGASGMVSGLATAIPEPFVALTAAVAAADLGAARAQQAVIHALLDQIPSGYRIGYIKMILQQRGLNVGPAVPPRPMPPLRDYWSAAGALL